MPYRLISTFTIAFAISKHFVLSLFCDFCQNGQTFNLKLLETGLCA